MHVALTAINSACRIVNDGGVLAVAFVPFAIDLGERMDVVRRLVIVDHFERLIHLEGEDVRNILAAFLVKRYGSLGAASSGAPAEM